MTCIRSGGRRSTRVVPSRVTTTALTKPWESRQLWNHAVSNVSRLTARDGARVKSTSPESIGSKPPVELVARAQLGS
jgi:hypothetical protein